MKIHFVVRGQTDELGDFYTAVFNRRVFRGSADPLRLEVDDIEATLTRVWDLGGTIVSAPDAGPGEMPAATFRDPSGRLVSIVRARAGFELERTSG